MLNINIIRFNVISKPVIFQSIIIRKMSHTWWYYKFNFETNLIVLPKILLRLTNNSLFTPTATYDSITRVNNGIKSLMDILISTYYTSVVMSDAY